MQEQDCAMGSGYERVLVPTDLSPWAAAPVERSPGITGIREVVPLHVSPPREHHGQGGGSGSCLSGCRWGRSFSCHAGNR